MERIRKQINNLSIRSTTKGKIQVFAPSKEMIAEFDSLDKAVDFAKNNKEYKHKNKEKVTKKRGRPAKEITWKLNNIDCLCDRINQSRGLSNRTIGSIEHYSSMTENLIVQVANDVGGFIPLASGTDKDLVTYLMNILKGEDYYANL